MDSTQKYSNLADYSIELSKSMQKFDRVYMSSKPPRQMGSFNVTLQSINNLMHNIKETLKMQGNMKKLAVIDPVAKKDNKNARKAADQINSIKSEVNQNLSRLKEEYFKQLELAGKQCREVESAIKDKEDRTRFHDASRSFLLMVYEAKTNKNIIPFTESDPLSKFKQAESISEHKDKEEQLNGISDFNIEDADKLEKALESLTTILNENPADKLAKDIKREVVQIKNALPPKTVAISKEGLEQIKKSSQLLLDLEQVSSVISSAQGFLGSDSKMQKINKQLDTLKPLLVKAIDEEQERYRDAKKQQANIQGKIDYATKAVETYGNILDGNARLGQEQIRIGNKTHPLYAENDRLKEQERKAIEDAKEIEAKPVDRRVLGDDKIVDELYEQARNNRETIRQNEEYMKGKSEEVVVTQLPPEYTDMKKRLQGVSSLYHPTIENSERMIR